MRMRYLAVAMTAILVAAPALATGRGNTGGGTNGGTTVNQPSATAGAAAFNRTRVNTRVDTRVNNQLRATGGRAAARAVGGAGGSSTVNIYGQQPGGADAGAGQAALRGDSGVLTGTNGVGRLTVRNTPDLPSYANVPTAPCIIPAGAAGTTSALGLSLNFGVRDAPCDTRNVAETARALDGEEVAREAMCNDSTYRGARRRAASMGHGRPCYEDMTPEQRANLTNPVQTSVPWAAPTTVAARPLTQEERCAAVGWRC